MPLRIHRRGEIWHYRGTVAGKLLRGSCQTADKTTAQRIAAEREARAWKGHLDGPESVLTFATAAVHYRRAGKSTRFLDKVEDYWKDAPVRRITAGAVRQGASTVFPNAGPATRNRQFIVPTQAIINHAATLGQCQKLRVERYKVEKREKTPATWEWVESFMAHANPHLGALACFLFLTGARITEALTVTWGDIDMPGRRVLIRQTKIGAERMAHLPSVLVAAVANIEGEREGKVFRYSSRETARPQWNKAVRRAGLKPLSFHACRHGFATACLRAGIDPVTTAKLGGWKSPAHVFATYGHAMDDATLTDRIAGAPPAQPASKGRKIA